MESQTQIFAATIQSELDNVFSLIHVCDGWIYKNSPLPGLEGLRAPSGSTRCESLLSPLVYGAGGES
jgi:hypothetical protein